MPFQIITGENMEQKNKGPFLLNNGFRKNYWFNPLDIFDWDDKIKRFENYSVFHTSEWLGVLVKSYGYESHFMCIDENGFEIIFPFLITKDIKGKKNLVSLPFTDFSDPLTNSNIITIKELLPLIASIDLLNINYIEFRSPLIVLEEEKALLNPDYIHLIKLEDEASMKKKFSHSTLTNINKALKSGIDVNIRNDSESLNTFYKLQCLTRKKHCLPPQPQFFFQNIFDLMISKNLGDIIIASKAGKPLASGIFLKFGNKVVFKYSNSDYQYQALRPNNLLVWFAMQYYARSGFKEFNFGKTEAGNEGLSRFKKGFGAYEIPFYRVRYYLKEKKFIYTNSVQNNLTKILFKFAPMNHLIRVGELFYKFSY